MVRAKFHRHKHSTASQGSKGSDINKSDNRHLSIKSFFRKSPWKMDFNQATGKQLIAAAKRIKGTRVEDRGVVDVILIGHSKSFLPYNETTLEEFLKWAKNNM